MPRERAQERAWQKEVIQEFNDAKQHFQELRLETNAGALIFGDIAFIGTSGRAVAARPIAMPGFWGVEDFCASCTEAKDPNIKGFLTNCGSPFCGELNTQAMKPSYLHFEDSTAIERALAAVSQELERTYPLWMEPLQASLEAQLITQLVAAAGRANFQVYCHARKLRHG